jgi:hypothetical protein
MRRTGSSGPMALTRRDLLARAGGFGLATATLGAGLASFPQVSQAKRVAASPVPLPTPEQFRADVQRMVDFGPRLTGSDQHTRYIEWLEQQFSDAGFELLDCDEYMTERWLAEDVALEVLAGPGEGPARVASYYPRSQETGVGGIEGPLVYAGTLPSPGLSVGPGGLEGIALALQSYPDEVVAWTKALPAGASKLAGSIVLVDVPAPVALTTAIDMLADTFLYWPGHTDEDWATGDYKRLWIVPGATGIPTSGFQALGAKGVVYILDSSFAALQGAYVPFENAFEPLPALYLDRDEGARLRELAAEAPQTRLTLTASRAKVPTRAVTAVLPGASEETLILNTHTDGQGFVEENGGVAFVALARHFASLPASERLQRTLVIAAWPGHMSADLPQCQGWIDDHQDLVKRAAAAITVEHLGATEWDDDPNTGYHATGQPELMAAYASSGLVEQIVQETVVANNCPHTTGQRPGVQFGVGGPFESAGVPQVGLIAGPEYLVTIGSDGEMDKFDPDLASRQVAWVADMLKLLDSPSAESLKQGDPVLGEPDAVQLSLYGRNQQSTPVDCEAPAPHLELSISPNNARTMRHKHELSGTLETNTAGIVDLTATLYRIRAGRWLAPTDVGQAAVVLSSGERHRFHIALDHKAESILRDERKIGFELVARLDLGGHTETLARARRVLPKR